jgi:N-acetylneuraminate synthase
LIVGYSDHSEGINVPIAATALGATIIEKHFTLDKTLPGPDHIASLDPNELAGMVRAIRIVENIMGDGLKMPMPSELANKKTARKSLVAAVSIKKGDVFTDKNITSKRPGMGISPIEYWGLLGTLAKKSYSRDDFIET